MVTQSCCGVPLAPLAPLLVPAQAAQAPAALARWRHCSRGRSASLRSPSPPATCDPVASSLVPSPAAGARHWMPACSGGKDCDDQPRIVAPAARADPAPQIRAQIRGCVFPLLPSPRIWGPAMFLPAHSASQISMHAYPFFRLVLLLVRHLRAFELPLVLHALSLLVAWPLSRQPRARQPPALWLRVPWLHVPWLHALWPRALWLRALWPHALWPHALWPLWPRALWPLLHLALPEEQHLLWRCLLLMEPRSACLPPHRLLLLLPPPEPSTPASPRLQRDRKPSARCRTPPARRT
mmetsp:Transcript_47850/g.114029  ORF Transcript_47850/g.114029 Transcript_47850/m.114029 type:complete len:295 (+) Transcript_47850:1059-1943(+)